MNKYYFVSYLYNGELRNACIDKHPCVWAAEYNYSVFELMKSSVSGVTSIPSIKIYFFSEVDKYTYLISNNKHQQDEVSQLNESFNFSE